MPHGRNPFATSIHLDKQSEPASCRSPRRSRAIDVALVIEDLSMTPGSGGWDGARHSVSAINIPDPPVHIYQRPKQGTKHSG